MSKAGESVLRGAREALAYARGETEVGFIAHVPRRIDVRAVRRRIGLSQARFAARFGFSLDALPRAVMRIGDAVTDLRQPVEYVGFEPRLAEISQLRRGFAIPRYRRMEMPDRMCLEIVGSKHLRID